MDRQLITDAHLVTLALAAEGGPGSRAPEEHYGALERGAVAIADVELYVPTP